MSQDLELEQDDLPYGFTPIWIKAPEGTSDTVMLERVMRIPEISQYKTNVSVLYENMRGKMNENLKQMCSTNEWKCIDCKNINGVEDQVIILLNTNVTPEYITRGINMLIIITNGDSFSR